MGEDTYNLFKKPGTAFCKKNEHKEAPEHTFQDMHRQTFSRWLHTSYVNIQHTEIQFYVHVELTRNKPRSHMTAVLCCPLLLSLPSHLLALQSIV